MKCSYLPLRWSVWKHAKRTIRYLSRSFTLEPSSTIRSPAQILAGDATFMNVDLNIGQKFNQLDRLEKNVKARGLDLDVKTLHVKYKKLQDLLKEKQSLKRQRTENAEIMKLLVKESKQQNREKDEVIERGKKIKTKLRDLMDSSFRQLESEVMSDVLQLPVDLHPQTPVDDETVIEKGLKPVFMFGAKNHVDLGSETKTIFFRNDISERAYYLLGQLSLLERHLVNEVTSRFRAYGLQQIISPDMIKSFVEVGYDMGHTQRMFQVEDKSDSGVKQNLDTRDSSADDYSFVLTGVSPSSFHASLSCMNVSTNVLPIKYFSVGTGYSAECSGEPGLFGAPQSICADIFAATEEEEGCNDIFNDYSKIITSVYEKLGLPFKLVMVGVGRLQSTESRRTDVFIWSAGCEKYIKCGYLSMHSTHISQRLTMKYSSNVDKIDNLNYLHTLSGRVMHISTVIGCLTEHFQNKDGTINVQQPKLNDTD